MSSELAMPSHHLILCRPLLLLPSVFPSIRVLSNELLLWIRRPKYWSFSFRISPSNEYSGLISLRIGWFDLLVKDTLKIKTTTKFESYCVPGTVLKSLYSFCVFSARTYASPLTNESTKTCKVSGQIVEVQGWAQKPLTPWSFLNFSYYRGKVLPPPSSHISWNPLLTLPILHPFNK